MKSMTQELIDKPALAAGLPDPPYMGPWLDLVEPWVRLRLSAAYETAKVIEAQTNVTLTVLLTGGGAALGLAAQWLEKGPGLWQASLAASGWLFAVAAWLVVHVLALRNFPGVSNKPADVLDAMKKGYSVEQARGYALERLAEGIPEAGRINAERADKLNWARGAACLTPLLAVGVYLVYVRG